MATYRFLTIWQIEAPLQQVFDAILDSHQWPLWWDGVAEVREIAIGDARGIGSVRRYVWQSPMLYRLRFDARAERIEQPYRIEASVSGDLIGRGCWHFSHYNRVTTVRYDWRVRTGRHWMNALTALLRQPFALNHRILMRRGGHGLARRLSAPLVGEWSLEAGAPRR